MKPTCTDEMDWSPKSVSTGSILAGLKPCRGTGAEGQGCSLRDGSWRDRRCRAEELESDILCMQIFRVKMTMSYRGLVFC